MGGRGVAVPRLSKQFNAGMSGMEPFQDQLNDVSVNIAAPLGNEKSTISKHIFSPQGYLQVSYNQCSLLSPDPFSVNPRLLRAIPAVNMLQGVNLHMTNFEAGKESLESQSDLSNKHSEFLTSSCLKRLRTSLNPNIGSSSGNPMSVLSSTYAEAANNFTESLRWVDHAEHMKDFVLPKLSYSATNTEGELADMPRNGDIEIPAQQSLASLKKKLDEDSYGALEPHGRVTFLPREAQNARDRLRRKKVSDGITILRNTVPTFDKGSQESVLDDAISYTKYLKLQLKVLSQSRLSGESSPYPFVHLEGYGHYLLNQQMCSDPLEEIMGLLMETNLQAATELLESKGLAILPMSSAYTLL